MAALGKSLQLRRSCGQLGIPIRIWLITCFSTQQLLAAPCNAWQLRQLLAAPGGSEGAPASSWQPLVAPGSSWYFRSSSRQLLAAQRQLLASPGSSWQLMVTQKLHWQLWAAPGGSGQFLQAHDSSRQWLANPKSAWLLAAFGSSWQLLAALGSSLLLPVAPGSPETAPGSSW